MRSLILSLLPLSRFGVARGVDFQVGPSLRETKVLRLTVVKGR
jgi:hypothetical protein